MTEEKFDKFIEEQITLIESTRNTLRDNIKRLHNQLCEIEPNSNICPCFNAFNYMINGEIKRVIQAKKVEKRLKGRLN